MVLHIFALGHIRGMVDLQVTNANIQYLWSLVLQPLMRPVLVQPLALRSDWILIVQQFL